MTRRARAAPCCRSGRRSAGHRAGDEHHAARPGASAGRRRSRPGRSRSPSTPAPRRAAGSRMKEPNIPKPTSSVATFVISTGGRASSLDVGDRLRRCAARAGPSRRGSRRRRRAARACAVRPSPSRSARAIASSGSVRPTVSTTAPRTSTRPGVRSGDSGISTCVSTAAIDGHRGADPEDPVVGGVVDEHAADHQARGRRRCRRWPRSGRCSSDDPLARELVADDREAEREDAAAGALQDAAGDDEPERVPQRGDDRAGARTRRARSRASGACRTCRRAGRRPACRRRPTSRYAVSVQATPLASVSSSSASSPSAGMSVVWASANASAATLRMSSDRIGCGRSARAGVTTGGAFRGGNGLRGPHRSNDPDSWVHFGASTGAGWGGGGAVRAGAPSGRH